MGHSARSDNESEINGCNMQVHCKSHMIVIAISCLDVQVLLSFSLFVLFVFIVIDYLSYMKSSSDST